MIKLFGKKTFIDRLGEAVGLKPKRSSHGAEGRDLLRRARPPGWPS